MLEDGLGTGRKAGLSSNNRILAKSISESVSQTACETGNRYNINTGTITLTSGSTSGVFYFKNNESFDFITSSFILLTSPSTGGTGALSLDVYYNPTSVSFSTDADIVANQNLGSANVLVADVYKGAEAATVTGGTRAISSIRNTGPTLIGVDRVIIPKGSSLAITVTPPTGNTSMDIQVAMPGYLATTVVTGA